MNSRNETPLHGVMYRGGSLELIVLHLLAPNMRPQQVTTTVFGGTPKVRQPLGSVPRSIDDPITSHECNVTGFLNMLVAARDAGLKALLNDWLEGVYTAPSFDAPRCPRSTSPNTSRNSRL